jgi:hypothetical protein
MSKVTQEVTLVTIHHERVALTVTVVLLIAMMTPPAEVMAAALDEVAELLALPKRTRKNLLMLMKMVMLLAKVKNTVKASLL